MDEPTVLIVPGLRDAVDEHWQTLLAHELRRVRTVAPMGRADLTCRSRVDALERAAQAIDGPLVIVAHSGGCLTVAHWARQSERAVLAALLAVPPDFESPMPEGHPTPAQLLAAGWLPVPRERLPFPSIVAASRNDPLGHIDCIAELAAAWGSDWVDLGEVGHLNPASGFGPWPQAHTLLARLQAAH